MFVEHLEDSLVKVYNVARTAPASGGRVMKTWQQAGVDRGMSTIELSKIDSTQLKCRL
jgi:hypothetical protein